MIAVEKTNRKSHYFGKKKLFSFFSNLLSAALTRVAEGERESEGRVPDAQLMRMGSKGNARV